MLQLNYQFQPYCLLPMLLLCTATVSGAVYRCEDPGKPVLYSQFQCPPRHQQQTVTPDPHNLINIPELSSAEEAALRRLKKDLADERARAQRARLKARAQQARTLAQNKARCEAARRDTAALQVRKRKGYSAAEARSLAELDRELQQIRKANC